MSSQKEELKKKRKAAREELRQLVEFWLMMIGSGKTSLIELYKLVKEWIPEKYPTLLPRLKDRKVDLFIRDVSSAPDLREPRQMFLGFQQAVIVCISLVHDTCDEKIKAITNLSSLLEEIDEAINGREIPIVLVGTKMDLRENKETHISSQEGESLRSKYRFDAYFETSMKHPDSVEKMLKGVYNLHCANVQGTFAKQIKSSAGCSLN